MKKINTFNEKKIDNDLKKVISLLSETNFNVLLFLKRIDKKLNNKKKNLLELMLKMKFIILGQLVSLKLNLIKRFLI